MMNLKINLFKKTLILSSLIFISAVTVNAESKDIRELLNQARVLFYESVEDEEKIEPAVNLFKELAQKDKKYKGRSLTYRGALEAIKGKHAFFPHQKLKFVKRGLKMMDSGVKISPDDVESLFIRGTTCHYLPFFFRRDDDVQRDFKKIIRLLPSKMDAYDVELIESVLEFIVEKVELDDSDMKYVREIKTKYSNK